MHKITKKIWRMLLCMGLAGSLAAGTVLTVPAAEAAPAADQAVTAEETDQDVIAAEADQAGIAEETDQGAIAAEGDIENAGLLPDGPVQEPAENTEEEPGTEGESEAEPGAGEDAGAEPGAEGSSVEETGSEEESGTEDETDENLNEDKSEAPEEEEEELEEDLPTGEEVAGAIHEIIEASSQLILADEEGIERLQEYIDDTEKSFEKLSAEDQEALSGSIESLGHAAVAVDVMQESMQQLEQTGTIILEQSRNENSFRFIDGVPVKDALQVVEAETAEVAEAQADDTLLLSEEAELLSLSVPAGEQPQVILVDTDDAKNGIDVSEWQGLIDWQQVKDGGIKFAIIRCGYGNDFYSQDDKYWLENVAACEELGIPYGVYLYSKATTNAMIDSEVAHTLRLLEGHNPQLPVYLDIEENSQFLLGDAELSKLAERYCSQIKAAGYKAGVYTGTYGWTYYISLFARDDNYFHWVAQWNPKGCSYAGRYEMWQNEVKPGVPGIVGDVDKDIWYGAFPEPAVSVPVPKPVTDGKPHIGYKSHVQSFGWEGSYVKDGAMSGTVGQSKRLEGIQIEVSNDPDLGVEYRTHVQTYGWENDWRAGGEISGTTGEGKRLEAIQIRLTGADAEKYDVYYCVHAQHFGWLNWAKNGESAGTAGYSYRLEGIRIRIVEKGAAAPENLGSNAGSFLEPLIKYNTHVQTYGWQSYAFDGDLAGTTGQSKRLEGIHIQLASQPYEGSIEYCTHIQTYGWESGWRKNGEMSGTSGQSKRLEAIRIRLTGEMAQHYDVYYQTHIQKFGWSGWARNGAKCGSAGYSRRLEGIRILLVPKGSAAPGSTVNTFYSR